MAELPEFHTFREAMSCIANGGAAYRYGSFYPLYSMQGGRIGRHFDGGSGGEMIDMLNEVNFTADQQASTNWVLFTKEQWQERQKAYCEAWDKIYRDREWYNRQQRDIDVMRALFR